MKEKEGTVFSVADENLPVEGCTVSRPVYDTADFGISYFSLAHDTDISAENYTYHKIIISSSGVLTVYCSDGREWNLHQLECLITPANIPVGMRTETGSIYTELRLKEGIIMNKAVNEGEIFTLSGLVPYQAGRIVNMDIINDAKMKFVVMAFDAGTGLSEHAAPGEALIFGLDGEGIIGYEGKEHRIKAGENFKFAKNGRHYVKAEGKFKMALLLTLED
ncbi:MAG: cupin domain-containing protein [Synergistaceae bacterium]|nr:cupin domain-containing protein [Synergistaceae bacterium]MBR0168064.1 cupin domain-containing protein [Synergistaceae bacterium]